MAGETLPPQATPSEHGPNWLYSDVELDVVHFSRSMAELELNRQKADAGATLIEELLGQWQESGRYFPFRAWARDVMDASEVDENGRMIPHRYNDGAPHEKIGGWIPADRYKVLEVHHDIKEGLMAWVQPQSDTRGTCYHILPEGLHLAVDDTILQEQDTVLPTRNTSQPDSPS